jgi:hypothetical protein
VKPVRVEVITYTPTVFYHCQHCELTFQQAGVGDRIHREQAREALPPELLEEYHYLSEWVHRLLDRHGSRLQIRLVDAASIEGVWKSVRFRVRRYPAVVVDGRAVHTGLDLDRMDAVIDAAIGNGPIEKEGTR